MGLFCCYMTHATCRIPALLTAKQKTDIKKKFSALMTRGIIDISQDLNDPARQEFDMTVLNAFGIEKYYDNIVDGLKAMRHIRKTAKQHATELRLVSGSKTHEPPVEQMLKHAADGDLPN